MGYRLGSLNYTASPRPLNTQYKSFFRRIEFENVPNKFLGGNYIWERDGVIYYSYYDTSTETNYQYRLDGTSWVEHTWDGYQHIQGYRVWKCGSNYYYSGYQSGTYYQYKLNGNRWESFNPGLDFTGENVWAISDTTVYATVSGITYSFSAYSETFSRAYGYQGIPNGNSVWSDGTRVYYGSTKILDNTQTLDNDFIDHSFNIPTFNMYYSFGGKIYAERFYFSGGTAVTDFYILVGNKFLLYNFPFPEDIPRELFFDGNIWSDGVNVYLSAKYSVGGTNIYYNYILEPADDTNFDHELPATANTVTINLYMNNSEKNVIGKSLTSVRNLNGTFKQEADIVNLSTQVDLSSLPNFNYIRVPLFNRYYFVDNIVNIRDGLWEISCHVDVLESFKDTIMSTYGLIERNEFEFNPKIIDHLRVIEQGVTTQVLTGGMTLETVLNAGVPQTMTETSPRFMLVGTFISLEGEIT